MRLKKLLALIFPLPFLAKSALAHCPLCTIGAAAAAGGAAMFGVNKAVIGLFIGAFAASIGWWFSRIIKKQYIRGQKALIILFSYATTVLPMLPMLKSPYPFMVSIGGEYGSLMNRTYVLDSFLLGSIIGLAIMSLTPWLSAKITEFRKGVQFPFQGIGLTFLLLIIIGAVIQFI